MSEPRRGHARRRTQQPGPATRIAQERLNQPGRIPRPALAATRNVFDSPAPKAPAGRLIGDAIHVAGGGLAMGGRVRGAVHEAFTPG